MTEANGCLPLLSSKEVQTSLLNVSAVSTSAATSTLNKSESIDVKTGRGKYERGHQLSRQPHGSISVKKSDDLKAKDIERSIEGSTMSPSTTRKEVGKLIFKMGEELRDLSANSLSRQGQEVTEDKSQDSLKPHCSNPLCRHNSPATTFSTSCKELICMCGRTMTMISLSDAVKADSTVGASSVQQKISPKRISRGESASRKPHLSSTTS